MTEEEIEAVAQELAKVGGSSWYPGRSEGPILRAVSKRYKDRARVAIAALDRFRAAKHLAGEMLQASGRPSIDGAETANERFQVGSVVVYRPPGDQRAVACRIEQIQADRVYLKPISQPDIGWVYVDSLRPLESAPNSQQQAIDL